MTGPEKGPGSRQSCTNNQCGPLSGGGGQIYSPVNFDSFISKNSTSASFNLAGNLSFSVDAFSEIGSAQSS